MFGDSSIVFIKLSSPNIFSDQSLFGLFMASVIQSVYSTTISQGTNAISFSFNNFEIFFTIPRAKPQDFIL